MPVAELGLAPDALAAALHPTCLVELDVSPVAGGSYWLRGSVLAEALSAGCSRCGAALGVHAAPATFELLLECDSRRSSRGASGKSGETEYDGEDVISFPPHVNSVDLSPVVRDSLLLQHGEPPVCQTCAQVKAPRVVAVYTTPGASRPRLGGGLASLAALKKRLPPPPP